MVVLAQTKFFEDEAFMNYLEYLEYFRGREYAKFITYAPILIFSVFLTSRYPTSLHILTLLKQREFRDAIMRGDIAKRLGDEIFEHFTKSATPTQTNGDTIAT
jgi:mediator of RNA polymerase II transcription subunit 31